MAEITDIESIPWDQRAGYIDRREISGCPLLDAFLETPLPGLCREVLAIRTSKTRRTYVEAALLTQATPGAISTVLDIHEEYIDAYRKVYFDVESMDRLSKIEVIEACQDADERNLKMWAITQGLDFLAWRLGKPVTLSPVEGLSALMSDSYFKAREAFFNNSTSASGQQALKWTKQTVEIAKLLKSWVSDSAEAMRDIEFALREYTEGSVQFDLLENLVDGGNDDDTIIEADFETMPNEGDE
jgi:hypothetical protein